MASTAEVPSRSQGSIIFLAPPPHHLTEVVMFNLVGLLKRL